ncbi:MAG: hypothetical protein Q4E84_01950 [Clostridia bacterium]|nr:hypothetical protein [Clostridia bacterium]
MSKYNKNNYSLSYALQNIGDTFWRTYQDDLLEYAKDQSRKDIIEHIRHDWTERWHMSPNGTQIRIDWAVAIYNHGDWEKSIRTSVPDYKASTLQESVIDPRREYPAAEYRCDNGGYVRSLSELCIANWLYANNIPFDYERAVMFGKTTAHCDFYLPEQNVYIEFWGMTNDENYIQYEQWKKPLYAKYGYKLVSLYPDDLKNLRDQFFRKLALQN